MSFISEKSIPTFTPKTSCFGSKIMLTDFGPELGMDNLYYMDYNFGDTNHQIPEGFISFSADRMNGPTRDIFIKWEAFEYGQSTN